jgi:hypothetical protein
MVLKNTKLERADRDYRLRILDDPILLQRCLDRLAIEVPSELSRFRRRRIERRLSVLVLRSRGAFPRKPLHLWFDIDTNLIGEGSTNHDPVARTRSLGLRKQNRAL